MCCFELIKARTKRIFCYTSLNKMYHNIIYHQKVFKTRRNQKYKKQIHNRCDGVKWNN